VASGEVLQVSVGDALLGRVIDGLGKAADFKEEPYATGLFMVAGMTVITTLLFLTLILALYFNFSGVVFIISKIFMIGMVSISFFTLQFTVKMPYFERKKNVSFTVFNGILHLGIAAFVIFFVSVL